MSSIIYVVFTFEVNIFLFCNVKYPVAKFFRLEHFSQFSKNVSEVILRFFKLRVLCLVGEINV